jgi:hypothetical protein
VRAEPDDRAGRPLTFVDELRAFWPIYLWHHRRPWTRRLHFAGSCACIAGLSAGIVAGSGWLPLGGIGVGYVFAFTGHIAFERNRPLTFGRPVLAGICNWVMFALELTGRLDRRLLEVEARAREEWEAIDVGSQ